MAMILPTLLAAAAGAPARGLPGSAELGAVKESKFTCKAPHHQDLAVGQGDGRVTKRIFFVLIYRKKYLSAKL